MNSSTAEPGRADSAPPPAYRGRFAPTPSGPLHLGSLLTALAGFLQARSAGGAWLLRVDDLDASRSRAEHAGTILRQLEAHGLNWDEAVRWQSRHVDEYEQAFADLQRRARLYVCTCTRATLARESLPGIDGPVYSGICRHERRDADRRGAWRLAVGSGTVQLIDPWQGLMRRDLATEVGDFVIRRADRQIGYQLACVVDEQALGITEVVRGADLIASSLRQTYLHQVLQRPAPEYRHLPVLLDRQGRKLSKQNHAEPIDKAHAPINLWHCLRLLGQRSLAPPGSETVEQMLRSAIANWEPLQIPARRDLRDH